MSRKSKKISLGVIIAAVLAIAGLICAIAGISSDWVSAGSDSYGGTLAEIAEGRNDITEAIGLYEGFDAANTFAMLTLVLCIATVIATAITLVIRLKLIKLVAVIVCILTVVSGAIALICTYNLCGNTWYSLVEATPAVGAWLLSMGGIVGGLGGAYVAVNR